MCARIPNGLSKKKAILLHRSIPFARQQQQLNRFFKATRQFLSTTLRRSSVVLLELMQLALALCRTACRCRLFCVVRFCSLWSSHTHTAKGSHVYAGFIYSRHVTFSYVGGAVSLDFSLQISNVSLLCLSRRRCRSLFSARCTSSASLYSYTRLRMCACICVCVLWISDEILCFRVNCCPLSAEASLP